VKRILLAEDDHHVAVLVEFCLEDLGLQIEHVSDGFEALEALRRSPAPDLVVLDLNLPGKSGIDILTELGAIPEARVPPVLVLSARAKDTDRAEALARGASAYLTKPFDTNDLVRAVTGLLA
jgi:CheY-like chemotaxis protein